MWLLRGSHSCSLAVYSFFQGAPESLEFRIFQKTRGTTISAWHDVPLFAGDGLLNFVCEIPKETAAKMELATDEVSNPIKQDTKKGKLRFYPYNIHWNYGMLPQTWEDPEHKNAECFNAGVRFSYYVPVLWGCICSNERTANHTHLNRHVGGDIKAFCNFEG